MKTRTPHLDGTSKLVATLSLAWIMALVACDVGETSSGAGGMTAIGGASPAVGGSSTSGATSAAGSGSGGMGQAGSGGSAFSPPAGGSGGGSTSGTFRVEAGKLYDRCGEQVILRGVNE